MISSSSSSTLSTSTTKMTSTLFVLLALFLSCLPLQVSARQRILLYTKTATFRHDSIPTAIDQIQQWGNTTWPYFEVIHTEDSNLFDQPDWLTQFDALVFVSTSGKILSRRGEKRMIEYIQKGGGFVGVHEASDSVYQPWYLRLIGAEFNYHPEICQAQLLVLPQASSHPSVSWIPKSQSWTVKDEMYNFNSDPRIYGHTVVLSPNESSYHDPVESIDQRASEQGSPHPIAWFKQSNLLNPVNWHVGGGTDDTPTSWPATGGPGRMFYTGLGHSNQTWLQDLGFKRHLLGGLGWVLNSTTIRSSNNNPTDQDSSSSLPGQPFQDPGPYKPFPEDASSASSASSTSSSGIAKGSSLSKHSSSSSCFSYIPFTLSISLALFLVPFLSLV